MPTAKFRQDTIRALQYSGSDNSQCIYWDSNLPGFGVRVFPNARKSFVCSYRVQGRKRLATLGRTDVLTLEQARKKARGYLVQVAEGEDPKAQDELETASATVKRLSEIYIERHAKIKKRSWRDDQSYLIRYVIPKLGSRLASTITSADVASLHAKIGEKHRYAANRAIEVVRKMYNLAGKWHVVPAGTLNPAAGIERFHEERRRRFVTAEEMPRLAKAIDSESNPFIRNALWLLLLTGLRRNELLKSQWADIDWKQRTRKLVMLTRMVGAGYKNRHATWCFGCRSRQGVSSIRHSNSPPGILGQDQGGI
jgi:integrase